MDSRSAGNDFYSVLYLWLWTQPHTWLSVFIKWIVQVWTNEQLSERVNCENHTFSCNRKILQRLSSSPHPFSDLFLQLLSIIFDSISLTFIHVPLWVLNSSLLFQSSFACYRHSSKGLLVHPQRVLLGATVYLSFWKDFDSWQKAAARKLQIRYHPSSWQWPGTRIIRLVLAHLSNFHFLLFIFSHIF